MKLTKLHLFLIVLTVLVASTLGFSIKEYFDSKVPENKLDYKGDRVNDAMDKADKYNPFENVLPRKHKKRHRKKKGSYDCLIAELEDNVNPHRRERRRRYDQEFDEDEDDKWILKSSIVPPVCPKCPDSRTCPRQKPCPPCKPCGRCPEPSFTCKKVPNYNVMNASALGGANGGAGGRGSSMSDGSYDSNGNLNGGRGGGNLPMARLNSFAQFN